MFVTHLHVGLRRLRGATQRRERCLKLPLRRRQGPDRSRRRRQRRQRRQGRELSLCGRLATCAKPAAPLGDWRGLCCCCSWRGSGGIGHAR
jgi:hypothetical protein